MSATTPATPPISDIAIDARDLACERGGRTVFENVGFSIARGGVLAIAGPNGAGKTSLLRIGAGLLREAAGSISLRTNTTVVTDREERGRFCAWLGHQDGVKVALTIRENIQFWSKLYAADAPPTLLDRVGLARLADAPAQYLSAGQRRRLALARIILCSRPLWLLDEPFAALDAAGRTLVADLVRDHCARGGIAMAATHEPLGLSEARLVLPP